jgi:gamma-glutamylcyclotransferase (GGCT)/AIG2-like uncharacterized protein YtfP
VGIFGRGVEDDSAADCSLGVGVQRVALAGDERQLRDDVGVMDDVSALASERLATYGTLAPGKPNGHQLAGLAGSWVAGVVRGRLVEAGWGAATGHPGIVLDDAGDEVSVHVFTSADLPSHWERLDAFEGHEYERQVVQVAVNGEFVVASIYALRGEGS